MFWNKTPKLSFSPPQAERGFASMLILFSAVAAALGLAVISASLTTSKYILDSQSQSSLESTMAQAAHILATDAGQRGRLVNINAQGAPAYVNTNNPPVVLPVMPLALPMMAANGQVAPQVVVASANPNEAVVANPTIKNNFLPVFFSGPREFAGKKFVYVSIAYKDPAEADFYERFNGAPVNAQYPGYYVDRSYSVPPASSVAFALLAPRGDGEITTSLSDVRQGICQPNDICRFVFVNELGNHYKKLTDSLGNVPDCTMAQPALAYGVGANFDPNRRGIGLLTWHIENQSWFCPQGLASHAVANNGVLPDCQPDEILTAVNSGTGGQTNIQLACRINTSALLNSRNGLLWNDGRLFNIMPPEAMLTLPVACQGLASTLTWAVEAVPDQDGASQHIQASINCGQSIALPSEACGQGYWRVFSRVNGASACLPFNAALLNPTGGRTWPAGSGMPTTCSGTPVFTAPMLVGKDLVCPNTVNGQGAIVPGARQQVCVDGYQLGFVRELGGWICHPNNEAEIKPANAFYINNTCPTNNFLKTQFIPNPNAPATMQLSCVGLADLIRDVSPAGITPTAQDALTITNGVFSYRHVGS